MNGPSVWASINAAERAANGEQRYTHTPERSAATIGPDQTK
jgi:hypothetical protein